MHRKADDIQRPLAGDESVTLLTVDPVKLPRVRYFRNRVHSIFPRFRRLMEKARCESAQRTEGNPLKSIEDAVKEVERKPEVPVAVVGDIRNIRFQSATSSTSAVEKLVTGDPRSCLVILCDVTIPRPDDAGLEKIASCMNRALELRERLAKSSPKLIVGISVDCITYKDMEGLRRLLHETVSSHEYSVLIATSATTARKQSDAHAQTNQERHHDAMDISLEREVSDVLENKLLDIVESMENHIKTLVSQETVPREIVTTLKKMLFEIGGIYNVSIRKEEKSRFLERPMPLTKELTKSLFSVPQVTGCGMIYEKLTIHIRQSQGESAKDDVRKRIGDVIKAHHYTSDYEVQVVSRAPELFNRCTAVTCCG